ncbi:SDR family NAD(P)-dependent oxidoreductase [Streptomyces spectabilis]|uniref:NAD(P)-dependent dehydrogenase (Short-subunit alcohol dehydrogenase family) n=1 Tax=Streptomyces spectabilis TaxID=68270 RepID=A0A5P2X6J3_STRST|nr:SDR family NAD(P)-dependent oxidoreductase [Streptomyces spectabilis]MBB5106740.1 NAD(P)-dependent dehydrogenase (short-subunit alcohol dehydrogenase family) [Streptomyces spectabilis]MCI3903407.1 SDR family oxidoreductase [Streptomyces spectabilis]QEV60617.1 SDR family oxidoreductase [Streptomyces spectabilis]GGV43556.1 3-hydroxyacyl-CoA dehydrogenase [Streptomyces spectabilis]
MGNFLAGKVVAVTGAGRGIGRAVAFAAAAEGAKVVVNDYGVSVEGGEPASEIADAVVKEIEAAGGEAVAVADDISTMAGGQRVVDAAREAYGRLDGAVCVAGILRERMLFNMTEREWDPVIATHLKGTFTVFRAASAVMRAQRSGTLIGFTSGNHQGSVSQANYSAAKGGIISLVRSAALGLHKYGVTANAVAPVARTRMSANVPMELTEIGEPEDVAALVVYLLSDRARDERITGQVYTVAGPKIAVWAQPRELRAAYVDGGLTPERIADQLPTAVGTDPMPLLERVEAMARAAARGARPNAAPTAPPDAPPGRSPSGPTA